MGRSDHVVLNSATQRFECKNCEESEHVSLPMGLDEILKASKKFEKNHKNCKEKQCQKIKKN